MKEIAAALLKVQQELDPIKKGKKGHNNKYADLPAVLDEAVETLNKHGIIVLQPIQPASTANHARVETMLIHAASGESISGSAEVPWRSDNKMNDAQSYGSAVTYARRYSLVSMLAIATEDDDGHVAHSRASRPAPAPKSAMTEAEKAASALQNAKTQAEAFKVFGGSPDDFWQANGQILQRINASNEFGDYVYPDARKVLIDAGLVEVA